MTTPRSPSTWTLAAADSACYVAKKQGPGKVNVYSARDEATARQSGDIQWLRTLQLALRDNRFRLYWQPIVSAFGAEAFAGRRVEHAIDEVARSRQ